ncbi:MAG TPA: hypothetical protein DEQ43_12065, partial [Nocardioides bacterium]|nr:hypothetical protein [Nocardioides sp.]
MSRRLTFAAASVGVLSAALAAGAVLVPAQAAAPSATSAAKAGQVRCVGSTTSCTAKVSLAGGASNRKVTIALPANNLRLVAAKPSNSNLDGAYLVSDQHMTPGRRSYTFTLNAAEAPA